MHHHVFRILDANLNRATEGLRSVEEYARFCLQDPFLSESLKRLRHQLGAAQDDLPANALIAARETQQDIGVAITSADEFERHDIEHVLQANLKRVQQSLRSLEEYGKVVASDFAARCERLRYEMYTLERALLIRSETLRSRLAAAQLYALVDGNDSESTFGQLVERLLEGGVDVLQLRDKKLDDRTLLQRAHQLRSLTRGTECLFIMNDRPDLAVIAHADGVHVGQEELSVADVRQVVFPQMLIGVSTHSVAQVEQAVRDGASYIGCGPVFPSSTKQFDEFVGLEFLSAVAQSSSIPAFAIGGIDHEKLPQVLTTGFWRIAVGSAVVEAECPQNAAQQLKDTLVGHTTT